MALAYYWCPLSQYGLDRGINYSAKSKFLLRPMTFSHKSFLLVINVNEIRYSMLCRPVVPGGAGGAIAPPDFGRSIRYLTLSQPRGVDYTHYVTNGTPGFSARPTTLFCMSPS